MAAKAGAPHGPSRTRGAVLVVACVLVAAFVVTAALHHDQPLVPQRAHLAGRAGGQGLHAGNPTAVCTCTNPERAVWSISRFLLNRLLARVGPWWEGPPMGQATVPGRLQHRMTQGN